MMAKGCTRNTKTRTETHRHQIHRHQIHRDTQTPDTQRHTDTCIRLMSTFRMCLHILSTPRHTSSRDANILLPPHTLPALPPPPPLYMLHTWSWLEGPRATAVPTRPRTRRTPPRLAKPGNLRPSLEGKKKKGKNDLCAPEARNAKGSPRPSLTKKDGGWGRGGGGGDGGLERVEVERGGERGERARETHGA
jgi:hypothetical protein